MEVYAPPAHYGEYIQHSVAITPAFAFVLYSICGSFEVQKQSVSNAFNYVALCTNVPVFDKNISYSCNAKIQILSRQPVYIPHLLNLFCSFVTKETNGIPCKPLIFKTY